MLQNPFGKLNMLEMKAIRPLLTNYIFTFWLYVVEAFIKEPYEENFGTAYETYKQSFKKDNSIRLQDVRGYLSKRTDIQVKSKPKTYNSFVSQGAKFEYEIDIMDMESKGATSNARYVFAAVGNFYQNCRGSSN